MSNTEEQKKISKKRMPFIFVVLTLLLIVCPAISYWYLREGWNWRVKAQSEIKGDYGKIRAAYIIYPDGEKIDQLKGKVCVLHLFGENPELTPTNKLIIDTYEELYKQYGYKPTSEIDEFRMVGISQGGSAEFRSYVQKIPSADMVNWVWTGGLGSWSSILNNGFDYYCAAEKVVPYPACYALTDTSGVIRRFYNAEDPKEVNRMVQQIALLLPK